LAPFGVAADRRYNRPVNERYYGGLSLLLAGLALAPASAAAPPTAAPPAPTGKPAPAPPRVGPPTPEQAEKSKASAAGTAFASAEASAIVGGVVTLERAGKPLGLGTVMNGDGRIVTALSALGNARHVDARYADGSVVPTRLGHAEHARDLALLVPDNARHKQGLRASRDTSGKLGALRPFVAAGGKATLGPAVAPAEGAAAPTGTDGKALTDAIAFATPLPMTSAGTPLLDTSGEVAAIATRAFRRAPGAPVAAVLVGTPVAVVREFLRTAPPTAAIPVGGIGVQGEAFDTGTARGVRVTAVRGPALAAGLRASRDPKVADVIVAIDGAPVTTPDLLAEVAGAHAVGDPLDLLVLSAGRYRHVTLVVAAAPKP
jgi:serine protease Do